MSTGNEYENHHAEMKNNRTSSFISVIIITTLFAFARKTQRTSILGGTVNCHANKANGNDSI